MNRGLKIIILLGFFSVLAAPIILIVDEFPLGQKAPPSPSAPDIRSEVTRLTHTAPSFTPSESEFLELDRVIREQGFANAWKFLKENYEDESGLVGNPHFLAHFFGRRLYEKLGINGIRFCDKSFSQGCYHGVFDEAVREQGKKGVTAARDVCYGSDSVSVTANCIHGIGHGLLAGRTRLVDLEEALGGCGVIPEQTRLSCHAGVFMEYLFSVPPSALPADDFWYPCSLLSERYRADCSLVQPHLLQAKRGLQFPAIVDICLSAKDSDMIENCFKGIGNFIGILSRGDIERVKQDCSVLPNQSRQDQCFTFAAGQLLFQQYQDAADLAPKLCDEVSLDAKTNCFSHIKNVQGSYQKP